MIASVIEPTETKIETQKENNTSTQTEKLDSKDNSGEKQLIFVTGGAGYIGSHTCVSLIENGYDVLILDDLSNSSIEAVDRIRTITNADEKQLHFIEGSICDRELLDSIFATNYIHAIIHFAGYKAVGESVEKPLEYYRNNVGGTITLLESARAHAVRRLVFSSSSTVYGDPESVPLYEDSPMRPTTNPYGETKAMIERILCDVSKTGNQYSFVFLRYFNPIGAHSSGLIGEDPNGIPNNLLPYISQVASGKLEKVRVFGDDYPTPDGTGVRDYIHVVDLARGHVDALKYIDSMEKIIAEDEELNDDSNNNSLQTRGMGTAVFNLGTGKGSSVLEVIHAFEKACDKEIPYEICERRSGDIAENYANCDKAKELMGWTAEYDLAKACEDTWNWQLKNPNGYKKN